MKSNCRVSPYSNSTIKEWGLWLLIPFCGLVSHIYTPFSPNILFLGLAFVSAFLLRDTFLRNEALPLSKTEWRDILPVLLFTVYVFFSQLFAPHSFRHSIGVCAAVLYFIGFRLLASDSPLVTLKSKIDLFFKICFGLYIFEAVFRYALGFYNSYKGITHLWSFYKFKFTSPLFFESNAAGIHLILLLFSAVLWFKIMQPQITDEVEKKKFRRLFTWIIGGFSLLLVLTLSRACILAGIGGGLLLFVPRLFHWRVRQIPVGKIVLSCILIGGLLFITLVLYPLMKTDLSFLSKFKIWESFICYVKTADWVRLLFGVGLQNSPSVMGGWYAHSYFIVFFVETGIVGFLLLLYTFIDFSVRTRGLALFILLPFIVATSTSTTTYIPELYLCMGILYSHIRGKSELLG